MRDKKQNMRELERVYLQSLQTNQESMALGPTFLERIETDLLQNH